MLIAQLEVPCAIRREVAQSILVYVMMGSRYRVDVRLEDLMMRRFPRRPFRYGDAVRMLGADELAIVKIIDRLGGATLTAASAGTLDTLAFFDVRDELVRWGNDIIRLIRDRISGLSRFDRTQRLVAAHTVIVITSFYEALGEAIDTPEGSVKLRDLELTGAEQVAIATDDAVVSSYWHMVEVLIDAPIPMPESHQSYEATLDLLRDYYRIASGRLMDFVKGLSSWEALPPHEKERLRGGIGGVCESASRRYQDNYRQLAAEVPEFAVWANVTDHQATRDAVKRVGGELRDRLDGLSLGLAGISEILAQAPDQASVNRIRTDLDRRYQAAIKSSILSGADAPDGVALPTLEAAYVNPVCRVAEIDEHALPAHEQWWDDTEIVSDIQQVLAGLLVAPRAVDVPLVVLGQPGAGKSVLTRVLAARLIESGFLPVRVELRTVPADASIQTQIEYAIQDATGRTISWPDLAESADSALPVVLLDGFDELLQATGVGRSDYLEQVAEFQRREYELGRPVAVIVTSRTVVADRARFPTGSVVMKLEPFNEAQVAEWLDVWNETNSVGFAARGIQPLRVEAALPHRELASQPLLLLMLALYDAGDNAFQRSETELSRAELYEQLLTDFARREVRKHHPDLDAAEEQRKIEVELRQLAVVALAMFNRRAQVVTETELNKDLPILLSEPVFSAGVNLRKPLTAAQLVIGRFFFVHESQAIRDSDTEHGFEFLHATFGEFLVAWIVVRTLRELVEEQAFNARRATPARLDDSFLWAALSFAVLVGRAAVVEFIDGLLKRLLSDERAAIRDLAIDLLGDALFPNPTRSFNNYEPQHNPVTSRHSAYSCNLAVLAVLSADEPVETGNWHARLWWSELTFEEWSGLWDTVRISWRYDESENASKFFAEQEDGSPVRLFDGFVAEISRDSNVPSSRINEFFDGFELAADSEGGKSFREMALLQSVPSRLAIILMPYYRYIEYGTIVRLDDGGDPRLIFSPARALLELRLAPFEAHGREIRTRLYHWCINASGLMEDRPGWLSTVFRQLREDSRYFDRHSIGDLLRHSAQYAAADLRGFLDVLAVSDDSEAISDVLKDLRDCISEVSEPEIRADIIAFYERHGFSDPFSAQDSD
jgi:hypothetical protein